MSQYLTSRTIIADKTVKLSTKRQANPKLKSRLPLVTGFLIYQNYAYFFKLGNGGGTLVGPSSSVAAARIITVFASPA